ERPGGFPKFSSSRWVDDVLVTAGDRAELHLERATDPGGGEPELTQEPWVSIVLRKRPFDEAQLVVVLDRRRAYDNIAEGELAGESAGGARADHNAQARDPFNQILSLYGELRLSVSAHRKQEA